MPLDGIVISKLVNELNEQCPMRINKIYSVGKSELLFNVRFNRQSERLIISGSSNQNRIHLTNRNYTHDSEPTNFVMLLRKHLINGQIIEVKQYDYDRIISLKIENHNAIGDTVYFYLYLELMGRYGNIIFTDDQNIILDATKRISPLDNPKVAIIPGAKYIVNSTQSKQLIINLENIDLNESLVDQIAGFSPTLDKEVKYRISNDQSFKDIIDLINNSNNLIISSDANSSDFHIIELTHKFNSFETVNFKDGFDNFYYDKSELDRIKVVTNDLLKFLRREVKKLSKKIIKLNSEYEHNKNSQINLKYGDLITTYQYQVKRGMPYVNLIDYDTDEEITINLDKKLNAIENAQKYYKLYRKQTNSLNHINEQIEQANADINYFTLLINQLEYADVNSALEIRSELVDRKYLFEKRKFKKAKKTKPNYLQIEFEGAIIKVGKNNLQNDHLLKNSNRNDYWFHVKDYHGSHVLVNSDNLSDEMIELAATLAAHFSQAKNSQNVAVDFTQVRNVQRSKVKGLVTLKEFETTIVTNDLNLIKQYI